MSFNNKHLTQGGQVVFYMIRMFIQINKIIFHYLLIGFVVSSFFIFFVANAHRFDAIKMGYYYYIAKLAGSFGRNGSITLNLRGNQLSVKSHDIINHPEFIKASDFLLSQIYLASIISLVLVFICAMVIYYYLGYKGKKQSEDDYVSGRKFEKDFKKVKHILKKEKIDSDIVISGLPIVKHSEIQNILLHGSVGTGKSTIINQYIKQISIKSLIAKGDKVIIYDRGNSFLPKFFDESKDYVLNPLDDRCVNWSLWDECLNKPDFDMFAASIIPEQGNGDPFWISAPKTVLSSISYEMRDKNPSYRKLLQYLLTVDSKTVCKLLKGTESENLFSDKVEKTTANIRNVITTYTKALAYMQGLDHQSKKKFTIREWITNPNDNGVLYITSNGAQHESIKPLITAWLSIAISSLFQLGEDRNRRVWFVLDEISSLHKLPVLNTMLAEGRKFGSCFVIGLQNIAQLEDIYGVKGAASLLDLLNTRYFFRSPNYDVAKRVSEQIGKTRFKIFNEQYAYGTAEVRDGVSFSKKEEDRTIVSPDDIMQLPDLMCYVTYPAKVPVTLLKLKYIHYDSKAKGFIQRIFDSSINDKDEENSIDILKKNIAKNSGGSSSNAGQEVSFIEKTDVVKLDKIEPLVRENEPKQNTVIGDREEININEAPKNEYEL